MRFGKGRYPAGLNFGDWFAYALAQVLSEPLLFKGEDFARTDAPAIDTSGTPGGEVVPPRAATRLALAALERLPAAAAWRSTRPRLLHRPTPSHAGSPSCLDPCPQA